MAVYGVLVVVLSLLFFVIYLVVTNPNVNHKKFDKGEKFEKALQVFDDVHIKGGYKKFIIMYAACSLSLLIVVVVAQINFLLILLMMVSLIYLPFFIINKIKKHRLELFEKQLPDAIDLMAGSLRSGNSLAGAFALIGEEFPRPLSDEIGLMVREQKLGVSIDESLQNFATRMPYNSVILTVSTIRTSMQTGGELSDALKNIAQTLRSIEQAEGKIKALTAQGKMQAWVVGLMPVALILVLSKMEPAAMSQLWTTKAGYMALAVIIIFEILGIIFIRKIVNIDV